MNERAARLRVAAGFGLLAVLFVATVMFANLSLDGWRLDLTEQRLYTVSDGTRKVLAKLRQPVNLYFFFSDRQSGGHALLRNYATRVRELLEEYVHYADGRLLLHVIDPEPYSAAEDRADEFRLQPVPLGDGGKLYFGLAGTNAVDDVETIAFFQPEREPFLEYDLSRLIHNLANPARPAVGVLSGLPLFGSYDVARQAPIPEWAVLQQLRQLFEVRRVGDDATAIDPELRVLLLAHPRELPPALAYAVDQFVLRGGRLLLFADPYADRDPRFQQASDPPAAGGIQASDAGGLLAAWGLELDPEQIAADRTLAMPVQSPGGLRPVRHVSFLAADARGISRESLITAQLARVTFAFPGALRPGAGFDGEFVPLIQTTADSRLIDKQHYRYLPDPAALLRDFAPGGAPLTLAARVRARPRTQFPDGPPAGAAAPPGGHLARAAEPVDMVAVADSDLLADRLWTRTQNFFGRRLLQPWAGNGDFVVNAVEALAGSSDLISLRGRAGFSRPFHVVEALRRRAEEQFRRKEEELQARLQEAERNLQRLQQRKAAGEEGLLTEQQRAEIESFRAERLRVRRELRAVRHELGRDIEALDFRLRLLNIWLMPFAATLAALGLWAAQRRRRARREAPA